MPMDRPTSGNCQATLGDGSTCGVSYDVRPQGSIAKYCPPHRSQKLRLALQREAARGVKADVEVAEREAKGVEPDERLCRATDCFIPLEDAWTNEFCIYHWRSLSQEVKGGLLDTTAGTEPYDVWTMRALRESSRNDGLSLDH